ncbi:putative zinc transporter msc2 [Knufia obscura]|uniref:Zinc transporter n=2 Tax=Knufia TaxID=430999 RepID=A0AAN8EWG8_9EURO|nr:putative zinc transporter msc2 [Knufia obscura]KAK5955201.1 putative zinc transporter msc2 [Knufia fluminis]
MASQHRHVSGLTDVLLHATEKYALLHGIIADEESRRIFYFMWLNLGFMIVQSTYGYLTGSLGLISDSIHMFFDCVALLVGVCAAVMSKWPPSAKFPYGYGKIDTLAGLGNGIFLMLISVEIVYEAFERLFEGATLQRTSELLYVSIAGLAVNMVGIFAFHGHHGHHHGHDHSHGGHSHAHDSHDPHTPSNAASASPTKPQASGGHGHHHHGGENMQGIYLHIMADALGSVAVVISTLLVQFTGWSGFDPLASCIIAVLIFISTIPLVSSTIKILLLSLNSDIEYNLRDVLGGVSSIRGVVGYTAPKFWLEDIKKDDHGHDHHHDHSHSHSHGQPHSHSHEQHNATAHTHNHDHSHDHANSHCSSDHSHSHPPSHSHTHDHDAAPEHAGNDPAILGTIHIQISQYADLRDVQARVTQYFYARKMDVVVQYERDGDNKCWCSASGSAGAMRTPQTGGMRTPISGSFSAGYPSGFMAQQIGGSQMREKGVGSPLQKML